MTLHLIPHLTLAVFPPLKATYLLLLLLFLHFLSPNNLSHLPASLLESDDTLMQLLNLPLLYLIPNFLLPNLAVKFIDLSAQLRDLGLTLLFFTGNIQDAVMVLLYF